MTRLALHFVFLCFYSCLFQNRYIYIYILNAFIIQGLQQIDSVDGGNTEFIAGVKGLFCLVWIGNPFQCFFFELQQLSQSHHTN